MNVILTAGGSSIVGEPLYELAHGKPKALMNIAGKPMLQWMLDALSEAQSINRVILVGLDEDIPMQCNKPLTILPNQGGIFQNMFAGTKKLQQMEPSAQKIIALSSDIPCIKGEMLDWFTQMILQSDEEVYYTVITRQTMEERYPGAKRSYYRLKDVEICGADIHAFDISVITHRPELWQRLIETRKSAFKQASLIGLDVFLALLLRLWTLDKIAARVTARIGIRGRTILSPFAEMGMDIDKPSQYQLVVQDLMRSI